MSNCATARLPERNSSLNLHFFMTSSAVYHLIYCCDIISNIHSIRLWFSTRICLFIWICCLDLGILFFRCDIHALYINHSHHSGGHCCRPAFNINVLHSANWHVIKIRTAQLQRTGDTFASQCLATPGVTWRVQRSTYPSGKEIVYQCYWSIKNCYCCKLRC